jgi:hypothetical protein
MNQEGRSQRRLSTNGKIALVAKPFLSTLNLSKGKKRLFRNVLGMQ